MSGVALVTGASSGIGAAVATALVARGYRVLGTTRDPGSLRDTQRLPGVDWLRLDLTDPESIIGCVRVAGPIDVLVNNAGESQSGPLEEIPADALQRVFALNVLGPVQLTQQLLPGMRERRRGRVVMVGSMLASFPLAFRSSYVATKAALKGFADAARGELAPYDVWITTVEPGSINTGISQRRTKYLADGSPYAADFHAMLTALDHNESAGISADTVAATVLRAIETRHPRPLYAVGSNAPAVFALRRVAPRALVHDIVARKHGLDPRRTR